MSYKLTREDIETKVENAREYEKLRRTSESHDGSIIRGLAEDVIELGKLALAPTSSLPGLTRSEMETLTLGLRLINKGLVNNGYLPGDKVEIVISRENFDALCERLLLMTDKLETTKPQEPTNRLLPSATSREKDLIVEALSSYADVCDDDPDAREAMEALVARIQASDTAV